MKAKYTISFANKTLLALCLLEIHLWGQQGKKYSVSVENDEALLKTTNTDIVDIVIESFERGQQYSIVKG